MSANLSRSPSRQEAFSSWNCNLHIIFRSALQQKKKLEFISNPLKKKKTHSRFCKPEAPDSSREREFHVSSSGLLKVHDHNLFLLGNKIH
jgi:hypothetical protein